MKRYINLFCTCIMIFMYGCFAPVNLTYESARTLDKGEVDIQANYSQYYGDGTSTFLNRNFGGKLGYGFNDWYTAKFRYERIEVQMDYAAGDWDFLVPDYAALNYYEIENKFKVMDNTIAVSLPIGYYQIVESEANSSGMLNLDPRAYFTFWGSSNKFELNIIPKFHILYDGYDWGFMPGISLGMAISTDLSKWSIRPEIGYDQYFSFGIAIGTSLTNIFKKKE